MSLLRVSQPRGFSVVSSLFVTGSVVLVKQMSVVGQDRRQVKCPTAVVVAMLSPM